MFNRIKREVLILLWEVILTIILFFIITGVEKISLFGFVIGLYIGAFAYLLLLFVRFIMGATNIIVKKIRGHDISIKVKWAIIGIAWSIPVIIYLNDIRIHGLHCF